MNDGLSAREQVWVAMSDMFLDSDIAFMLEGPARVLAASPYDIETLDRILLEDVYPICANNLRCAAGIWTGFDAQALRARISERNARSYPLLRFWIPFRRRALRSMVPQWPDLKRQVVALREGARRPMSAG
ncbi:MAG: hypothetical protein AAGF36_13920 [Pseudomonadota bacterium]